MKDDDYYELRHLDHANEEDEWCHECECWGCECREEDL